MSAYAEDFICRHKILFDKVYQRTVAAYLSLTYSVYTKVLVEFLIHLHTLVLTCLNVCITYLLRISNFCHIEAIRPHTLWMHNVLNLFAVSVFVTYVKLISNLFSVH